MPDDGSPLTVTDLRVLLERQGKLFSEQLGIALRSLSSDELFRWFLASLLFGARIHESVAIRTFGALTAHGLVTPEAVAGASFNALLQVMGEGGYVRYDGVTSRKLQGAARKLIDEYAGDLNQLHGAARDPQDLLSRLTDFWGVGPVTAGIFLRELRGLWPKADPPSGDLALLAADHLGVGDLRLFWERHGIAGYDQRHLEAALTRIGRDFCRRRRCSRAPVPH